MLSVLFRLKIPYRYKFQDLSHYYQGYYHKITNINFVKNQFRQFYRCFRNLWVVFPYDYKKNKIYIENNNQRDIFYNLYYHYNQDFWHLHIQQDQKNITMYNIFRDKKKIIYVRILSFQVQKCTFQYFYLNAIQQK